MSTPAKLSPAPTALWTSTCGCDRQDPVSSDQDVSPFAERQRDHLAFSDGGQLKLNAAIKVPGKGVVMAMGCIVIKEQKLPFTIMISEDDASKVDTEVAPFPLFDGAAAETAKPVPCMTVNLTSPV